MNNQRQHCLQPHVAQRRHRVTGVGYALNVKPPKDIVAGSLLSNGNGGASALLVEDQATSSARGEQQPAQTIGRREQRSGNGNQRQDENRPLYRPVHCGAKEHGQRAHRRRRNRQHAERAHQTEHGHQKKACEQGSGDSSGCVEGEDCSDISACPLCSCSQTKHCREGSTQQNRWHEDNAESCNRKLGAHSGEIAAGSREDEIAGFDLNS